MSTVGIIAEYNPFHNGHAYQIKKAKELTGASDVIIIMSGNYVQRGTPSIIDKHSRASHAIQNGASLIIELPVCYATSSAELFAHSSICLLNKLGVVDYLSFGCEDDNIEQLDKIATILANEPDDYKTILKKHLALGESYPIARKNSLCEFLNDNNITSLLETPNNILATEYLKALIKTHSTIKPIPIKRIDNGYHSLDTDTNFASATAIRNLLYKDDSAQINSFLPENTLSLYKSYNSFVEANDFSQILAKELIYNQNFDRFYDISSFLSNRINKLKSNFEDIDSFTKLLLTKNETYTHISRGLIHILLGITKDDILEFTENGTVFYINPLSFDISHRDLLKRIKNNSSIEIINKFGDYYKKQTGTIKKMLDMNTYADRLYNYIHFSKNGIKPYTDFRRI